MSVSNADLANLLWEASETLDGHRARAYRRAARAALRWPEEAFDVLGSDRSLQDLPAIGARLAARLSTWLEDPPEIEVPESRRGFRSVAWARQELGGDTSWREELQGDLQSHTVFSDGKDSLADMCRAAIERGYEYLAVTDHSEGLRIAGGMDAATLAGQGRDIDALNRSLGKSGFRLLKGIELNLDTEGRGDMTGSALEELELVVGSFHSSLRTKDDQTSRYLGALRNPQVHILGHPRGRMYGTRTGLNARWDEVFAAAAETGTAVEIDCHPNRQDLQIELLELVRGAGAWVSIGTDAHSIDELGAMDLGLASARAAGIPRDRIINYLSTEELRTWLRGRGPTRPAG